MLPNLLVSIQALTQNLIDNIINVNIWYIIHEYILADGEE